jgi:hypothetical protein
MPTAAARECARRHQRDQYQRGSKPEHCHGCLHISIFRSRRALDLAIRLEARLIEIAVIVPLTNY